MLLNKYNRCKECARHSKKDYYERHKERILQRNKEYRLLNVTSIKNQRKEYYINNRDKIIEKVIKSASQTKYKKMGITLENAISLRMRSCQLCGYENKDYLVIDHNESTGKFRGCLCRNCNLKIIWVERLGIGKIENYIKR